MLMVTKIPWAAWRGFQSPLARACLAPLITDSPISATANQTGAGCELNTWNSSAPSTTPAAQHLIVHEQQPVAGIDLFEEDGAAGIGVGDEPLVPWKPRPATTAAIPLAESNRMPPG